MRSLLHHKGFSFVNACRDGASGAVDISINRRCKDAEDFCMTGFYWSVHNGHLDIARSLMTAYNITPSMITPRLMRTIIRNAPSRVLEFLYGECKLDYNPYAMCHGIKNYMAKRIQTFWRRQTLRRKLLSVVRQIIPLYYHPDAVGGLRAKHDMSKFLRTVSHASNTNAVSV